MCVLVETVDIRLSLSAVGQDIIATLLLVPGEAVYTRVTSPVNLRMSFSFAQTPACSNLSLACCAKSSSATRATGLPNSAANIGTTCACRSHVAQ